MKDNWIHKVVLSHKLSPEDAKSWGAGLITIVVGLNHYGGSARPHFTVTGTIHKYTDPNNDRGFVAGGCIHDEILKVRPDLAPLVALHLSDDDGQPMHAEANGWYWLTGALGGMGERHHGGNSKPERSPDECLKIFAEHCRIPIPNARLIADNVQKSTNPRNEWRGICVNMSTRWAREAQVGIELLKNLTA